MQFCPVYLGGSVLNWKPLVCEGLHACIIDVCCACPQPVSRSAEEEVLQASLENVVEDQHMLTSLTNEKNFQ